MKRFLFIMMLSVGISAVAQEVKEGETLSEVTVKGARVVQRIDGQTIYPTQQQLAASTNGYSLLSKLTLPHIRIDPVMHTVTALSNTGSAQVRINDIVATRGDLLALTVNDVRRVEYIDNPGLRYGEDVAYVVNLIVKKSLSGYVIGADLTNTLTAVNGNETLYGKFNHRKSEFGASYTLDYYRYTGMEQDEQAAYEMETGSISRVHRRILDGTRSRLAHNGQLSYSLTDSNDVFQAKLNASHLLRPSHTHITWQTDAEDIHMNVESLLTERIGEAGKRLHTGRSRNDQVALDTRMYARKACRETEDLLKELLQVLLDTAQENLHTVMPGYTHLQKAQPITLAHHLTAYVQMFLRDRERFRRAGEAADVMVLGSGALAGTTYPLNRERVAELLGFSRISENSLDGVSDRDFLLDYLSAASICMMHLSRFCEELILWNTNEFRFVEMDDGFATGSSIMPQKKNPDVAELIRGKTGRVYGDLMGLLTTLKGLPLAYNKDMQEDKEGVFDACDTVKMCLTILTPMLATMTVNRENMLRAAQGGFINATDLADWLVKKGMPFRSAYKISGELVRTCMETGCVLETLPLEIYRQHCPLFDESLYTAIDLKTCMEKRISEGGTSVASVEKQIAFVRKELKT